MKLTKELFEWSSGWLGDSKYNYSIKLSSTNDTEHTIELVKTSCVILSKDGATVGGGFNNEEDVYMDPDESAKFNVSGSYESIYKSAVSDHPDSVEAQIDTTFFRREFFNLGEIDVPADDGGVSFIEDHKDVAGCDLKILGATISRAPSDDADRSVEACVGLRNLGTDAQQKAMVKMILIDRSGAQIDYSENEAMIPPRSGAVITPSVSTKAGRLKGASVKLTVTLFQPVAMESITIDAPTKQS